MHEYATNSPHKLKLYFGLAIASIATAGALSFAAAQFSIYFRINVASVSSLAVFTALFLLFDQYLWRNKFCRKFLLVPDLNGEWLCEAQTRKKNGEDVDWNWSGTITIKQSWTKISIQLQAGKSQSVSICASLNQLDGQQFQLRYVYDNEPDAMLSESDMRRHYGCVRLFFNPNATEGAGAYFTDGERTTSGGMTLTRKAL